MQARRTSLSYVAISVVIACTAAQPACTSFKRIMTYPGIDPILDADWYTPVESVAGNSGSPLSLIDPALTPIPDSAIVEARNYAKENQSCAFLVLHDNRLVHEEYWCGIGRDSRVNTMSMSKAIVGLLAGIAVARGDIGSIDDKAAQYISEWAGDPRAGISLRHLLQMTTGLRNDANPYNLCSDIVQVHFGENVEERVTAIPLESAPGAAFDYNNFNTQILSIILERVSGRRFARYLSEHLWQPLGASDAGVWLDRPGGAAKTYCCLLARARDWARIGLLILNQGRVGDVQIVPEPWIADMLTPSAREPNYGLHMWLGYTWSERRKEDWSEPFEAKDTAMIVGSAEQRVYIIPSRRLVVVRLGREAPKWDDVAIPNMLVRGIDRRMKATASHEPG